MTNSLWSGALSTPANIPHGRGEAGRGELQRLRRRKGLSQEELAHRARIHQTYLSRVEGGKRNPSIGVLGAKELRRRYRRAVPPASERWILTLPAQTVAPPLCANANPRPLRKRACVKLLLAAQGV